jgi:hypothetical protein
MQTGLNYRVMGYSDGFYGDGGESFGFDTTKNFLTFHMLDGAVYREISSSLHRYI